MDEFQKEINWINAEIEYNESLLKAAAPPELAAYRRDNIKHLTTIKGFIVAWCSLSPKWKESNG